MSDIQTLVDRYNTAATERDRDLALTHIVRKTDILTPAEIRAWIDDKRPAQYRAKILNWLIYQFNAQLRDDVPELIQIFGKAELKRMLEVSRERYPSFNLVMGIYAGDEGLELAGFFEPTPESPWCGETDFPIQSYWEEIDLFWGEQPDGSDNSFDFTVNCYPNENFMSSGKGFPEWWFDPDTNPYDPKDENLIYVEQLFMDDWAKEVASNYQAQKASMNERVGTNRFR
jgi:hypothetical protein